MDAGTGLYYIFTYFNVFIVVAILESYTYLVCTYNRGVFGGEPVIVGKEEVKKIIDFEK